MNKNSNYINNIKYNNTSKGFTLTELIVVIVIIGILAAVLIPSLTNYIDKAKRLKVESNSITYVDNYIADISNNIGLEEALNLYNNTYLYYEDNYYCVVYNHKVVINCVKELPSCVNYSDTSNTNTYKWNSINLINNNQIVLDSTNNYLVEAIIDTPSVTNNTYLKDLIDYINGLDYESKKTYFTFQKDSISKLVYVSKDYIDSYMNDHEPPIKSNSSFEECFIILTTNKENSIDSSISIIKGDFYYQLGNNSWYKISYTVEGNVYTDDSIEETEYTNAKYIYEHLTKSSK